MVPFAVDEEGGDEWRVTMLTADVGVARVPFAGGRCAFFGGI